MRASILRLFNICFSQLANCITALLNDMSAIPKSKGRARDATLRNAGEILMRTDHKIRFLNALRVAGVEHILVVNI